MSEHLIDTVPAAKSDDLVAVPRPRPSTSRADGNQSMMRVRIVERNVPRQSNGGPAK